MFLTVGSIFAVLMFAGSSLLQNPPPVLVTSTSKGQEESNSDEEARMITEPERSKAINLSPSELFKYPQAWLLWVQFLFSAISGVFLLGTYKSFGNSQEHLTDDSFLQVAGSILSIFNCLGRFVNGFLCDRYTFKPVLTVSSIIQAILMLSFTMCVEFPASQQRFMFVLWLSAIGFCYGGNFSLFPTATMHMFGRKHGGANYGIMFTAMGVAALLGTQLKATLTQSIGFQGITIAMGTLCFICHCLTYALRLPKIN